MRCHIRVDGTERDEIDSWSLVVSIDETRALLARDETFLDIVLGEIARMNRFSENGGAVTAKLERFAREGTSNPACLIPAEAVQLIRCPDFFAPADPPVVHIDMKERRIHLSDGQSYDLYDFCSVPADRWENARYRHKRETSHIFGYRHIWNQGDAVHETDLECGSLITGLFDVLLPVRWGAVTQEFITLAGIILGLRGDIFNGCVSTPIRTGASSLPEMRSTFLSEGHVASNRAWMPTQMLPGKDFAACREAARPDLLALGARLSDVAEKADKDLSASAILHLLAQMGEDPVQFSLRDRHRRELSNHQTLEMERLIRETAEAAQVDLDTFDWRTPA